MNEEKLILCVAGINHKTSSISEREIFQINKKEISGALNYFKSRNGIAGAVIISTCNRLEFYFVVKEGIDTFSIINEYFINSKQVNANSKRDLFYFFHGTDVAVHLFRVISGLESALLGEYQIQGQIKDAYSVACSAKTTEKILHKLFHAAFRAGKCVRTQTKIGSGKQSLSGVAFQLIRETLKKEDTITIVGVNENTRIVAERLYESGFINLNFVNRTLYKAEKLAEKYNGTAYCLERIAEPLTRSSCLFTCTGSPDYIINSRLLNKIYEQNGIPELVIDMAIPRDVDCSGITHEIKVFNLENLKAYLENDKIIASSDISHSGKNN